MALSISFMLSVTEDPIRSASPHGWVNLIKEMKEVNPKMKYGSRYLYKSPEEIEKVEFLVFNIKFFIS